MQRPDDADQPPIPLRQECRGEAARYPASVPRSTRTPGPIVELSDTFCT